MQLTLQALNRLVSLLAKALSTNLTEKPKVHKPCRIGLSYPLTAAILGSICKGFVSPMNK